MKFNNYYFRKTDELLNKLEKLGYKVDRYYLDALPFNHCVIRNGNVLGVDKLIDFNPSIDKELTEADFKELVFSTNGEEYYDDIDYIIHCFEEDEKIDSVYVAEKVEILHENVLTHWTINSFKEYLEDAAYEMSEYSDQYLRDLTDAKKKELHKILLDWFNKNIEQPRWYDVKNVKRITKDEFLEQFN